MPFSAAVFSFMQSNLLHTPLSPLFRGENTTIFPLSRGAGGC